MYIIFTLYTAQKDEFVMCKLYNVHSFAQVQAMYETVYDEDLDVQNLGCTAQFMYCYDFQSGSAQEGRVVS